jgi:hypothetical protein
MKLSISKTLLLTSVGMFALNFSVLAGPGPEAFPHRVYTKKQAEELPEKAKRAFSCDGCKTVKEEDKNTFLSWFSEDNHNCPGCDGKITYKGGNPPGKAPAVPVFTHTCSKCGESSAYTCSDHQS